MILGSDVSQFQLDGTVCWITIPGTIQNLLLEDQA